MSEGSEFPSRGIMGYTYIDQLNRSSIPTKPALSEKDGLLNKCLLNGGRDDVGRVQGSEQTAMQELSAQHLSRFDLAKLMSCHGPSTPLACNPLPGSCLPYHFLRYVSRLHLGPGHLQDKISVCPALSAMPFLASIILCGH